MEKIDEDVSVEGKKEKGVFVVIQPVALKGCLEWRYRSHDAGSVFVYLEWS